MTEKKKSTSTTRKSATAKAKDELEARVERLEEWIGSQGISLNPAPAPAAEGAAEPEAPKKLTLEERIARLEEVARTQAGFNL